VGGLNRIAPGHAIVSNGMSKVLDILAAKRLAYSIPSPESNTGEDRAEPVQRSRWHQVRRISQPFSLGKTDNRPRGAFPQNDAETQRTIPETRQPHEHDIFELDRLAEDVGDASAQYSLGLMYDTGEGVGQNFVEAVRLYDLAAGQGHAAAQCNLGLMYDSGTGVPKDEAEAVRLYHLAADQGDTNAQFNLGVMYRYGTGVLRNANAAAALYRLAAAKGDAAAQCNLGVMSENGEGVAEDVAEAVRLYRLAAGQGLAEAQSNLGVMYANGIGVRRDVAEAARLFRLAAAQNNVEASCNLRGLSESDGVVPGPIPSGDAMANETAAVDPTEHPAEAGGRSNPAV
jgi:TPR repeat protein